MPKPNAKARKAKAQRSAAAGAGVFAAVAAHNPAAPARCGPTATDKFGRQTTLPDQEGWYPLEGATGGYDADDSDDGAWAPRNGCTRPRARGGCFLLRVRRTCSTACCRRPHFARAQAWASPPRSRAPCQHAGMWTLLLRRRG